MQDLLLENNILYDVKINLTDVFHDKSNQHCMKTMASSTSNTSSHPNQSYNNINRIFKACDECCVEFRTKRGFHAHMLSHHCDGKDYICSVCGDEFSLKSELFKHMETHTYRKCVDGHDSQARTARSVVLENGVNNIVGANTEKRIDVNETLCESEDYDYFTYISVKVGRIPKKTRPNCFNCTFSLTRSNSLSHFNKKGSLRYVTHERETTTNLDFSISDDSNNYDGLELGSLLQVLNNNDVELSEVGNDISSLDRMVNVMTEDIQDGSDSNCTIIAQDIHEETLKKNTGVNILKSDLDWEPLKKESHKKPTTNTYDDDMSSHLSRKSILKCERCGKVFKNSKTLRYHAAANCRSPFYKSLVKCSVCGERYNSGSVIHKHYGECHPQRFTYKCQLCCFRYQFSWKLNRHIASVHEKSVQSRNVALKHPDKKSDNKNDFDSNSSGKCPVEPSEVRGKYKCLKCTKMFSSHTERLKHSKEKHPFTFKPRKCKKCSEILHSRYLVRRHMVDVHGQIENKRGPLISTLYGHCEICNRDFYSKHTYEYHMSSHSTGKPTVYKCETCDKVFKHALTFHYHTAAKCRPHYAKQLVKCSVCGEEYKSGSIIHQHYGECHPERFTYKCQFCCFRYHFSWKLNRHIAAVHEKPSLSRNKESNTTDRQIDHENDDMSVKLPGTSDGMKQNHGCYHCSKVFSSHRERYEHVKQKHAPKPAKCKECPSIFKSAYKLRQHMKTVHHVTECKSASSTSDLYGHCDACNRDFFTKHTYDFHMASHTNHAIKLACEICGKKLKNALTLKSHLKLHNPEHNFDRPCEICGKITHNEKSYKLHLYTHTGEKTFTCSICGLNFLIKGQLKSHLRIHSDDTFKFVCPVCGKRYRHDSSLNYHARTHTNERPYPCDVCEKSFRDKKALSCHKKTVHFHERRHVCTICDVAYSHSHTLKMHMSKKHGLGGRLPQTDKQ